MSAFYTIKSLTKGIYKEKGSKFISVAVPVNAEDAIQDSLESLRKEYHDARHHCYAWVLGMDEQSYRANDDGEPNHSAGDPILGQIRSHELTNCLVVVVRYFGGTKLGVGGLINAYKTAADSALTSATRISQFEKVQVRLCFPYQILSQIERLVNRYEVEAIDRDFRQSCILKGVLKKDFLQRFEADCSPLHLLKLKVNP